MKRHLVVSLSVIAAAGALIMQTTPVQASPLVSTVGTPLPKLGGGDQQWVVDAGKAVVSGAVSGAVGGAVTTAVIGTPSIIAGAGVGGLAGAATGFATYVVSTGFDVASASSTDATSSPSTTEAATDASDNGSTDGSSDSSQTGQDSSGGTVVRSGSTASPIYDHFGISQQNPGGTVSQPGLGGLTPGKLATIGASRLD